MKGSTVYERAQARDEEAAGLSRQQALAVGLDREARIGSETLGEYCTRAGHDYDRVYREWQAGRLWIRRRRATGELGVQLGEQLRAAMDAAGTDVVSDATLPALEDEAITEDND